ncbi:MAG TPA: hypothetical protein VE135_08620 [Pyrinomonadaceae bacterium]|nr:hypothetical protein [Pyrinomonadaceae bacterium]
MTDGIVCPTSKIRSAALLSSYSITTASSLEELPAKSSEPWVWVGFIFAFAFFVGEFVVLFTGMDEAGANLLLISIGLMGFIYWLFCVHRFHKILREMSAKSYGITPGEAVGRHFIPFLNLVWIFKWPAAFSEYINGRGRVHMISGNVIGLFLLISLLLRFLDGAVGLACLFGVTLYLSAKLRKHMQLVKGMDLPPVLDASIFRQPQEATSTFGNTAP